MIRRIASFLIVFALGSSSYPISTWASERLRLSEALEKALKQHPSIQSAELATEISTLAKRQSLSQYGWQSKLSADLRWIDNSGSSLFQTHDDSRAELLLSKTLYDFGQKKSLSQAGDFQIQAAQSQLASLQSAQRLKVLSAFFQVLISDLKFNLSNEKMAIRFIELDRARERLELDQISEIRLAELDAEYQAIRRQQQTDDLARQQTRLLLAQYMGEPNQLRSELDWPELPGLLESIPVFSAIKAQVLQHPALLAMEASIQAAESLSLAAAQSKRASIRVEAGMNHYENQIGNRTPGRVSLILDWPITNGGKSRYQSEKLALEAESLAQQYQNQVWQHQYRLMQVLQSIASLQAEMQQRETERDFIGLYMDRSRIRYEMEVETDFGDALVKQSRLMLETAETRAKLALAWTELADLTQNDQYLPYSLEP